MCVGDIMLICWFCECYLITVYFFWIQACSSSEISGRQLLFNKTNVTFKLFIWLFASCYAPHKLYFCKIYRVNKTNITLWSSGSCTG